MIARQAQLIARWMLLGFIHGVMNTDNTSISGETIDYGPCAFMEAYDPATVFSSIDHQGRYAYGNQPRVGTVESGASCRSFATHSGAGGGKQRVCGGLGQRSSLRPWSQPFKAARSSGLLRKLGLFTEREGDSALAA